MLIEMTADPTTTLALASSSTEMGVRFRITAKALPESQRPPLDLGLVIDTSGSMEGDAIEAVRASAKRLVGKLRDGDRISIVAFDSTARVIVPNTPVTTASRARLEHAIDELQPRGTTALYDGLAAGLQQVLASRFPQGINRIVLLSDGVPNTSAQLPPLVAQIHQYGISVTSLGIGVDYDTTLMTQIARDTGGKFTYIDKPDEVGKVFDQELAKMETIVGRNLTLAIQPGPGVTIEPMPGLAPAGDGKFYATIGDLPAGETRDLMIPIRVAARGDGSTIELVEGVLGFDDVIGSSGHRERDAYVGIHASSDAAKVRAAIAIDLEAARVRSSAAAAILEAMTLARSGQVAAAQKRIAEAIAAVRAAVARTHDASLEQLIEQLSAVGKQLAQVVVQPQPIASGQRNSPQPAVAPPTVEPELRKAEAAAQATVQGMSPR